MSKRKAERETKYSATLIKNKYGLSSFNRFHLQHSVFYVAYQKKKNIKKNVKTVADITRVIFNVVHNEKDGAIRISFKVFLFRY
jgi:hypothetical protein